MTAPGETDLARMLASLRIERRPGVFAYVSGVYPDLLAVAEAIVTESDAVTYIVPVEVARAAGIPFQFEAAWLTLSVFSSLDAIGLTAAVSGALAAVGIPCNVLAGFNHDHLLVPVASADLAIAALTA